jgi:hypothetical protein
MAKSRIKIGAGALIILGVAALGYALYKGWIKLPFGDLFRGAAEGAEVAGMPGAIGGAAYNLMQPGGDTLGERIEGSIVSGQAAGWIAEDTTPGLGYISGETGFIPTPEQLQYKAGERHAAQDIFTGPFGIQALGILPPTSGYTIGTGLGIATTRGPYIESLPQEAQQWEKYHEYKRRSEFMGTPGGILARILSFGLADVMHQTISPTVAEVPHERRASYFMERAPGMVAFGAIPGVGPQMLLREAQSIRRTTKTGRIMYNPAELGKRIIARAAPRPSFEPGPKVTTAIQNVATVNPLFAGKMQRQVEMVKEVLKR